MYYILKIYTSTIKYNGTLMVILCLHVYYIVSALPGLLMSLDLYSTSSLEDAQSVQPLTQFMVSATLKKWLFPQDEATSKQQLLKPTRILLESNSIINFAYLCFDLFHLSI